MKLFRSITLLVLLLSSLGAMAQVGLYAEGSLANLTGLTHNGAPNVGWIVGPTFGGYAQGSVHKTLRIGGDIRGQFFNRNDSNYNNSGVALNSKLYNFLIGPRIAIKPLVIPLEPYAEYLFGVAHENETGSIPGQSVPLSGTGGAYQLVAGVDYSFLPLFNWRILEVSYGSASANVNNNGLTGNVSSHPFIISTGIVFVLPHK